MLTKTVLSRFFSIAALIAILAGAWYFRATLLLVFLSIVLAIIISMPSGWMQKHGSKKGIAVFLSTIGTLVITMLLVVIILPKLIEGVGSLAQAVPKTVNNIAQGYENFRSNNPKLENILPSVQDLTDQGNSLTTEQKTKATSSAIGTTFGVVTRGVQNIGGFLINFLIVFVMAIFFLISPKEYMRVCLFLLPEKSHKRFSELTETIYHSLTIWLKTLSLSMGITFALVWLFLSLVQFPSALVVALIAAASTFIPNVGAIIPIFAIAIFGLAAENISLTLIAIPIYVIIQLLESLVITPSIVKSQLNILPAGVLIFQIIAGKLFGALGVMLTVPLLLVVIISVREIYSYDHLKLKGKL